MGKGRYLKSAEQACARKARFETALEAERTAEWRYRAYRCPVCGQFHLTSQAAPLTERERPTPPPQERGPKLADLDWSAALDPAPKARAPRPAKPKKPVLPPPPPEPPAVVARCTGPCGKDGRVPLVIDGRLVKSGKVTDPKIRAGVGPGVEVRVAPGTSPPHILRLN